MSTFDRDAFLADRKAMLLALDPAHMRAYLRKYGERVPDEGPRGDHVCMIAMHKARCDALDLPTSERLKSRFWLRSHGFSVDL